MSNRKALLGKKLGMSQVWDENGFFVPVTLVDVSTNVVTAVKTEESDGYKAVQLGYGAIDPTKVTKPLAGHFAKAGVTPRRHLVEVRTDDVDQFEAGQELAGSKRGTDRLTWRKSRCRGRRDRRTTKERRAAVRAVPSSASVWPGLTARRTQDHRVR